MRLSWSISPPAHDTGQNIPHCAKLWAVLRNAIALLAGAERHRNQKPILIQSP
ncbi:hypothetical protein GXM_10163 [Nostoc sphaeroides CCNUC1]|uniref:Uncharacterized protein n=1 Tax=Nostoc sphaeroides CCNUC1 TaxID=2653204 RepID=A0A5P8WLW6_9NOSO|nr:hypothetical protein GXM_10163 [Nostoc sphaeroides CCNUC1]